MIIEVVPYTPDGLTSQPAYQTYKIKIALYPKGDRFSSDTIYHSIEAADEAVEKLEKRLYK